MNNDGTTKSNPIVPNNMPPTVLTPTEILPLAPTPCANISGNMPKIIVMEVIRIGRKRAFLQRMLMLSVLVLRRVRMHDRNTVHNMNVCKRDDFSQIQDKDNRENPAEICLQSCFQ